MSSVLPETFCQKKRSYSKITEKRTFYPKITEKRTFWPKKTEKERNSGAQKNGLRSLERVLATLCKHCLFLKKKTFGFMLTDQQILRHNSVSNKSSK